jgi:hypothetical protein
MDDRGGRDEVILEHRLVATMQQPRPGPAGARIEGQHLLRIGQSLDPRLDRARLRRILLARQLNAAPKLGERRRR